MGPFGTIWGRFVRQVISGQFLGPFGATFWCHLELFRATLGPFGAIWGHLGPLLGPFGTTFGAIWGHLGSFCPSGVLGAVFGAI